MLVIVLNLSYAFDYMIHYFCIVFTCVFIRTFSTRRVIAPPTI